MQKRDFLKVGAASFGATLWPSWAFAQKHVFGNPITVVLPLQAGSASDDAVGYVTASLSAGMDANFV